jgi:hypothetical protein
MQQGAAKGEVRTKLGQLEERALRNMRDRIFDYSDDKAEQADRVLLILKHRALRSRPVTKQQTGPFSGLTCGELRASGTCEPDWF